MTAEIRKRHLAHAITLALQVRRILFDIANNPERQLEPIDIFTMDTAAIDVAELLLTHLQKLHAEILEPRGA